MSTPMQVLDLTMQMLSFLFPQQYWISFSCRIWIVVPCRLVIWFFLCYESSQQYSFSFHSWLNGLAFQTSLVCFSLIFYLVMGYFSRSFSTRRSMADFSRLLLGCFLDLESCKLPGSHSSSYQLNSLVKLRTPHNPKVSSLVAPNLNWHPRHLKNACQTTVRPFYS